MNAAERVWWLAPDRPVEGGTVNIRPDEPADLTEQEDRHLRALLARVTAGLMTLDEAALILRCAHPDLSERIRAITGTPAG